MEVQETCGVTQRSFASPICTPLPIVQRAFVLEKKKFINVRLFVELELMWKTWKHFWNKGE